MHVVTEDVAHQDKSSHVFRHGRGYVHVGKQVMPRKPKAAAAACLPLATAADKSWHLLASPCGNALVRMWWSVKDQHWVPVQGTGNRVGFEAAYLAAHGWQYEGPL